jgi:hypothetical protein
MTNTYEADILLWSEHQGALLRRIATGESPSEQPDWGHIADEIESVGRSQVDAVESLLFQAMVLDLKAEAWPLSCDVPNWRANARGFRLQARRRFAPSMRKRIDVTGLYADALQVIPETIDGQPPLPVPDVCPVTLDELLENPA